MIYKIKATYGAGVGEYYVYASTQKEARQKFSNIISWLKIISIEETKIKKEDLNLYKYILI